MLLVCCMYVDTFRQVWWSKKGGHDKQAGRNNCEKKRKQNEPANSALRLLLKQQAGWVACYAGWGLFFFSCVLYFVSGVLLPLL